MRITTMLRRVILAALALCLLVASVAMANTNDFTFALNAGGDGYIVTKYTGSAATVTVPDWYNSLPVTGIGDSAFQGNSSLVTVYLPDSLVSLGALAFKGCKNLEKIGEYAASSEPPAPEYILGDADDNGTVEIYDALLVLQYSAGWSVSVEAANADMDASGTVDINDALLILQNCADAN